MKRSRHFCLAVIAGALLGTSVVSAANDRRKSSAPAPKAGAAVSPAQSFDAFQLIVERNIFNPSRVGRTRATPEDKPPRVDEISLVGTMQYDKGIVAFFDSPDAAFRKVLREGESVADFKVQRIAADGVELLRGDQPVALKITQQLRRPEGGEWTVRATPSAGPAPAATAGGSIAARPAETTAEPELPADAAEVLKRLMKKREKQLK